MVPDYDKLNEDKLKLLEEGPKLLHLLLKHKFPEAAAGSPSDSKGYYEDIEKILNE